MLSTCESPPSLTRIAVAEPAHTPAPTTAANASATADLPYDPNGPDRDCGDFDRWDQAQAFYRRLVGRRAIGTASTVTVTASPASHCREPLIARLARSPSRGAGLSARVLPILGTKKARTQGAGWGDHRTWRWSPLRGSQPSAPTSSGCPLSSRRARGTHVGEEVTGGDHLAPPSSRQRARPENETG